MQKRCGKENQSPSGAGFENPHCPFFRPAFDDFLAREREKLSKAVFRPDVAGLEKRILLLGRFKIPWQSIDNFRTMRGMNFEAFFSHCTKSNEFFSENELRTNTSDALRKEAVKFFLRLDVDKDGVLGPSDADERGLITEDSQLECIRHGLFSKNAPYGNRINQGLIGFHNDIEKKARWTEKFITEKSRTIKDGSRRIYCYDLPVQYLPVWLCGTKILHISDIHFKGKESDSQKIDFLKSIPRLLEKAPELVLMTGDFVTSKSTDLGEKALSALGSLFPNAFRAFVLGNHDMLCPDYQKISGSLSNAGYIDVTNIHSRVELHGFPINIFGMDDYNEGKPRAPAVPDMCRLETNILITHNLDAVRGNLPGCFDLVLSGHTHAGEQNFWLFSGFDYLRHIDRSLLDINNQRREWKMLSQRTASYMSPGLGSHTFRFNTAREGVTLISLWG